jgi:hypothetical protein
MKKEFSFCQSWFWARQFKHEVKNTVTESEPEMSDFLEVTLFSKRRKPLNQQRNVTGE